MDQNVCPYEFQKPGKNGHHNVEELQVSRENILFYFINIFGHMLIIILIEALKKLKNKYVLKKNAQK